MSETPDRPATIDPSADPGRDLPADPVLGSAAAALLHRARWGASSNIGRLARRIAIESALLAVLRAHFPPGAAPVQFGRILDLAAQVAAFDPAEAYWAGRRLLAGGRLPRGWPQDLPRAEGLRWRTTEGFGLATHELADLVAPGEPQPPALPANEFYVSEPVSQGISRFPLSEDLPSLEASAPLPAHGAGVGVMLGWVHRVLTSLRRPQLLIYWVRFWNEQADRYGTLDAAATALAERDRRSPGSLRLFAAARAETQRAGPAGDPDRLSAFIEGGDATLTADRGEVLAAMRAALGAWYHVAPEMWTARPWGPPGRQQVFGFALGTGEVIDLRPAASRA